MSVCGFFFTSVLTFSAHFLQSRAGSGALGQETLLSPKLVQMSSVVSSGVVLRCYAPLGHSGRVFQLYHVQTLVDTQQFNTEQSYADFQLNTSAADTEEFYCCRYDHSMYSPYTRLLPPPGPAAPPIPPELSVLPPNGRVRSGEVVEFHCQAPPTHATVTYILQKKHQHNEDFQDVSHSINPQFRVGPVGMADGGMYTCFYKLNLPEGVRNSAPSTPVSVSVEVELPAPELSQGGEGALVCTGSHSYPGAHFTLFQQGSSLPLATQRANMIEHSVQFTASGQQREGGRYQCQYSVLLGKNWAHSQLSTPIILPCVTGSSSCSFPTDNHPPQTSSMDLALVFGSVSAALLFLMALILLAFGIRKYATIAAKNRRQREQEQFWQHVHSRDHIIDLTLQRVRTGSKEERGASVSEPIYDSPLSTFTHPLGY